MMNLASLLVNDDAFDSAFNKTHIENKAMHKRPTGMELDHLDSLIKQASKFYVDGYEHTYKDNDAIFYLREPVSYTKPSQCCTCCTTPFQDKKEMVFCQFCGNASC